MFEEEMRSALETLVVEAAELLDDMERGLLDLERGEGDAETVNALFRAAHTIKGSAGLFGLDHVVSFGHVVESILDRVRSHELPISADLIGVLLPCKDHIARLLDRVAAGEMSESDEHRDGGATLLRRLEPFLVDEGPARPESGDGVGEVSAGNQKSDVVHLSLRFGPDCLRNGMDPISFIRYLGTLGEIISVTAVDDMLPEPAAMDPETCYLVYQLTLRTDAEIAAIEGIFDFVRDDSDVRVLPAGSAPSLYRDLAASFGSHAPRIQQILIDTNAVSAVGLQADGHPATQGDAATAATAPGEQPASWAPGKSPDRRKNDSGTLRVDATRLDRLIDTVGELVIAGAGAKLRASSSDEELRASIGEVMRLIEGVREDALRLRMVPIGTTFSRFQRIVRDVAAGLGKEVSLVISGGDTEVDKVLVEHIGDPLMHLVRNALDHGIEATDVRIARGKPARGTLRLDAHHDSGTIVVVIEDDGGGIDRDKVLEQAVKRGLVEPNAALSDEDVYALLFEPGFSTASVVSDLSGRGVGLDVVKRNVAAVRGTIAVTSRPGEGTTVRIRLPLTLAIIEGFMVGVANTTFVIPLDRVVECVGLPATSRHRGFMDLRDEVLPLIRLRSLMSVDGPPSRRENVVVVEHNGAKTGLVVDALMGEFQTVIKPLGKLFAHVEGVGGSTILGNGEVALILDVPLLVRHAMDLVA